MTDGLREKVRAALALVERDWMQGDNLAVTLCSEIETRLDADTDPGTDTGWAEEVSEEYDATLNAMADAIMALVQPVVTEDDVERAVDVFETEVRKEQHYDPLNAGVTNLAIFRKVLTAALPQDSASSSD